MSDIKIAPLKKQERDFDSIENIKKAFSGSFEEFKKMCDVFAGSMANMGLTAKEVEVALISFREALKRHEDVDFEDFFEEVDLEETEEWKVLCKRVDDEKERILQGEDPLEVVRSRFKK